MFLMNFMIITNLMLSTHVGQGCWPSTHVPYIRTWGILLVHTFMAMFLVLQNLVACVQTKKLKKKVSLSLSLSYFQFDVTGMFDSYLCFPCLFCAWLAGSMEAPAHEHPEGSLPATTEYADTRAGSSNLTNATLHSLHATSAWANVLHVAWSLCSESSIC